MNLQYVILIFPLLWVGHCSVENCCHGENIIVAKKCVEGSINDVLHCPNRFLMNTKDVDNIDEFKGQQSFIGKEGNSFCRTNLNDTEVLIVCYSPEDVNEEPSKLFAFLGFGSSVFLVLTAAIYIALPKLLDLQGICVVHSVLGLAFVFIIMGINRLRDGISNDFFCQFNAYSLYFCSLYAFFWLNAYSFHLWRITTQPKLMATVNHWKTITYIYGCGCPLALLLLVITFQNSNIYIYTHPRMAEEAICWFGTLEASFVYMYGPISVLLILNIIYFVLTICTLWKEIQQHDGKRMRIIRYRCSLCFKMFFVMGISWIFEVLSAAFEHKYPSFLWKVSDTINSLQGVLIFLVMVVFRKRVYRLLAEKPYSQCLPSTWRSIEGDEEEEEDFTDDNDLKLNSVLSPEN